MRIEIPFKTPSVNHLYFTFRNLKILTKEARELKKQILEIVEEKPELFEKKLKVIVEIYENWYYKNGAVKRADVSNREKFLIDAVFDGLGIDDRYIFEQILIKKQSEKEFAVIEIIVLP